MKRVLAFFLIACMLPILYSAHRVNAQECLTPGIDCLLQDPLLVKHGVPSQTICFTDADFREAFGISHYPSITILALPQPEVGVLKLHDLRVAIGQTIPRCRISELTFTPASSLVEEASFSFSAGELSGGGTLTCRMVFSSEENSPPTTEGMASSRFLLTAMQNMSVLGTLAGYDPDGDTLEYLITSYPKEGTLTMTDTARGDFRYTPKQGYTGTDTFTYVLRDRTGRYSTPNTVSIHVKKGTIDLEIEDVWGDHASAIYQMVSCGIMGVSGGETGIVFSPKKAVTRAEWVAMVMRAAGILLPYDKTPTFFDDDGDIPDTLRPYVKAASERGYLVGEWTGDKLVCRPNDPITRGEAALILNSLLPKEEALPCFSASDKDSLTDREAVACASLYQKGVFVLRGDKALPDGVLTREIAAEMLSRASQYTP